MLVIAECKKRVIHFSVKNKRTINTKNSKQIENAFFGKIQARITN